MLKFNKLIVTSLISILFVLSGYGARVETEKIIVSNDFVVVSNATFGSVTIGGVTQTNWPVSSGEAGKQMLSLTGTNTITYTQIYNSPPHIVIQTYTGATYQITYDVIAETTNGATFLARNSGGLETNTGVKVTFIILGNNRSFPCYK